MDAWWLDPKLNYLTNCWREFFAESEIRCSNLQNKLLQITILSFNFEIPAHNSNSFKFLAQDSDLE